MNAHDATHIVFPFFDRHSATAAFPVARTMARTLKAPLHVLAPPSSFADVQDFTRPTAPPAEAHGALDIEAASGDLIDAALQKVAGSAQAMLIVALRLRDEASGNEAPMFEVFGQQVLEKIRCPILIVPPDRDMNSWELRRELLPQDGTPSCAAALAHIVGQATRSGVENLVLRVAGANVGQPTEPGSLPTPRYVDHPQYEWDAWGQEFLERVQGMGVNPGAAGMRLLMANGDPATEILRISKEKDVDLIILPWHGVLQSGRARMVKAVLQNASCPVLLVPLCSERRKHRR